MRSKIWTCITAIFLIAMLAGWNRLAAQEQTQNNHATHYKVFNLGALPGGAASSGNAIDSRGVVTGVSNLAGNTDVRATVWVGGRAFDLGTLGGANSAVVWPFKSDDRIVGISETANVDRLGEYWSCSAFFIPPPTLHTCLGFVWRRGVMSSLPTLGGDNGYASGSNHNGQEVGWAENTVHDPTCIAPQVLQFEAVIYGPGKDQIQQLPPYRNDVDGAATAINDKGQVVGISGTCDNAVGAYTAKHMLLWQNGGVTKLPTLGGKGWNTPYAINNRGEVVGFSDLKGDVVGGVLTFNAHAFIWTKESGRTADLGTLPGDSISEAEDINDQGQIVGLSCGATTCRAFLYENGKMMDMNKLIPQNSGLYLTSAAAIDSRGVITGQACVLTDGVCDATNEMPAFVAIPQPGGWNNNEAAESNEAPTVTLPENVRQQLLRPRGFGGVAAELAKPQ